MLEIGQLAQILPGRGGQTSRMAVQAPFPQEISRRQGLEGTSGDHLVYLPAPRQEQQYLHQSSQMFVCLVSGTAHWLGSVPRS